MTTHSKIISATSFRFLFPVDMLIWTDSESNKNTLISTMHNSLITIVSGQESPVVPGGVPPPPPLPPAAAAPLPVPASSGMLSTGQHYFTKKVIV